MANIEIITLDSGIKVVMEELDHVKSAALGIWVRNGAVNETLRFPEFHILLNI